MKHWIAVALLIASCTSCRKPEPEPVPAPSLFDPAAVDGDRAFAELKRIVGMGLRDSGTPGAANAARYLNARLAAQGVEASIDTFTHPTPRGPTVFRNVIGRIPGRGKGLIIIGSHYDTPSGIGEGFEGANDSGSSSALLLELAGVLAKGPVVDPEIWLVFFDGEECMVHYGPADGLHGSRRMVRRLIRQERHKQVIAMILMDMVGDRDLNVTIPRNSTPELVKLFFDSAKEEGVREKFGLYPFEIGDDHEPFLSAGIPAIDIIDFQYGSAPGRNDYWHTPEDTLDKISPQSLQTVGRIVIRMINGLVWEKPLEERL